MTFLAAAGMVSQVPGTILLSLSTGGGHPAFAEVVFSHIKLVIITIIYSHT